MSEAVRILHGDFGRVALLKLNKPMTVHAHRMCHVIFKVDGPDIEFGIRDRQYPLGSENVLLVNAWDAHFYEHRQTGRSTTLLALYLDPSWLKTLDSKFVVSVHPRFFGDPSIPQTVKVAQFRVDLFDLLISRESPSPYVVADLISKLIIELTSKATRWNDLSLSQLIGGVAYDPRIRHSLDMIQACALATPDFDEIACSVGLSRPHFFNLFRKQTGMTPGTFGSMIRMEKSIAAIACTGTALQDVAFDLGFDSPGNFTRFFVAQQGVTPSQYRQRVEFIPTAKRL